MWWSNGRLTRCGVGVEQTPLAAGGHGHPDRVRDALAERAGGDLDAVGVAVLRVSRGQRPPGAQRLQVIELEPESAEVELDVLGQARVPAGQHETVAAGPVRLGRIVSHHLLVEQVRRRGQADRRTRVPVAHLLHGVGGEQPDGVDRSHIEIGPTLRQDGCGGLARIHVDGPSDGGHANPTLAARTRRHVHGKPIEGAGGAAPGPSAADKGGGVCHPPVEVRICGSGPRLTHDRRSTPGSVASRRRERLPW